MQRNQIAFLKLALRRKRSRGPEILKKEEMYWLQLFGSQGKSIELEGCSVLTDSGGKTCSVSIQCRQGPVVLVPTSAVSFETFRGRKKGYVPLLMHPFIPSSVWIGGCELSVKPRQAPVLPFPGRTFPPVDLPPFYQALVEMLGDLTTCFPYWQRLALVCACVCVCVQWEWWRRLSFGCKKAAQMAEQRRAPVLPSPSGAWVLSCFQTRQICPCLLSLFLADQIP